MILDIHTHLPGPKPGAVIAASPEEIEELYERFPEQKWSVGYHPWDIGATGLAEDHPERLRRVASLERVVAVGETGIDKTRIGETPLFAQINAFNAHIEVARSLGKPLILHAVKAQDVIIPLLDGVEVPVVIHGFRQKPGIADMYLRAGCYLSFGERYNAETLLHTPLERIVAETDCSPASVEEVISGMHALRTEITDTLVANNISKILVKEDF